MNTTDFHDMHLSEETLRAIDALGYQTPTPIQQEAISMLMQGYDLIGQSQTGSGKTAAFAIPLIERIEPMDRDLQAVVLVPTRELCVQVSGEIRKLLKYHASIRVAAVFGGQPIDHQIKQLKGGVQIVVGTPGRFMDHCRRHTLKCRSVHTVVLDEADEMLDMGFREDMESILKQMPKERQTVMFSATMPAAILSLADTYMHDPVHIRAGSDVLTPTETEEIYYDLKEKMKPEALKRILKIQEPGLTLVFCNTIRRVDLVTARMKEEGLEVSKLHGDMPQTDRDAVMKQFRAHEIPLLIATDVAARGLDIENIDLVVNYDVPDQVEFYVHRIGRTGRAGKTGHAVTFVVGRELEHLKEIMAYTGREIVLKQLPSLADLNEKHADQLEDQIRTLIRNDPMDHSLDQGRGLVDVLILDGYDPTDIAAALMQLCLNPSGDAEFDLNLDRINRANQIAPPDQKPDAMITLYIDAGTRQHIRAKDLVGAIAAVTGLPSRALGRIDVSETLTRVEVPARYEQDVIKLLDGEAIRGYTVHVTRDHPVSRTKKQKPSSSGHKHRR